MDLNPENYTLNEISQFFNLEPNHTFSQINNAFRKKHNEVTLNSSMSKEQKDEITSFFEQLKNKLVLHLSTMNVPHNNFSNGFGVVANGGEKIDDHVETVTNNQILYPAVHTKSINSGIMNPIERNIIKTVVNFDTRFKQNYVVESTTSTCKNTKFSFNFPTPFKNVISIAPHSVEIPNFIYNVTTTLKNNTFVVNYNSGADTTITIDEGKYTGTTLAAEVQSKLVVVNAGFTAAIDADSGILSIANGNAAFTLNFSRINDRVNLGYILGFRDIDYSSSGVGNTVTADKVVDTDFVNYFYLSVNDYQRSVNNNMYAIVNKNFVAKNIFAKLQNKEPNNNTDLYVKRSYFGPVTLERITFELLDKYGNALDLKGLDYSFSVELEILYKY